MIAMKDKWDGTLMLMLIVQPREECLIGVKATKAHKL